MTGGDRLEKVQSSRFSPNDLWGIFSEFRHVMEKKDVQCNKIIDKSVSYYIFIMTGNIN